MILLKDDDLAALFVTLKARKIGRMRLADATKIGYWRLRDIEHKRGQPASDEERRLIASAIPQLLKN